MVVNQRGRFRGAATTPELIAAALRTEILSGEIPPGWPLRQEELAERFGVSRLPVRDALVRLEGQGLVQVLPNRGAFVVSLSAHEIREIYEIRILLEGDLIEQAVPLITDADWSRIESAHAASVRSAGRPEWVEGDWDLHRALYLPAARPRQLAIVETLRGTVARYWHAYSSLPARSDDWVADHDGIVQACRARSAGAAKRRVVEHLRRALEVVIAGLDTTD